MKKFLIIPLLVAFVFAPSIMLAGCITTPDKPAAPNPKIEGNLITWEAVTFKGFKIAYTVRLLYNNGIGIHGFVGDGALKNGWFSTTELSFNMQTSISSYWKNTKSIDRIQVRTEAIEIITSEDQPDREFAHHSKWATVKIPGGFWEAMAS